MLCNYPNCRYPQKFIPVIEIPTVRTKGMSDEMVETDRPTVLIGEAICRLHMDTYIFTEWLGRHEWEIIKEAAEEKGFKLQMGKNVIVTFKPLGWEPGHDHMELMRS